MTRGTVPGTVPLGDARAQARAGAVAAALAARTGRAPEGVWWAPGRVNLIGEHTDYNEGFVLPLAIDLGTAVAAARRGDGTVRCVSLEEPDEGSFAVACLAPGRVEGWTAYVGGIAWALREAGVGLGGADLAVGTTLPLGSGLSSSAALLCAAGLALAELYGAEISPRELALHAQRAETAVAGVPVGAMDQLAAMLGETGAALLVDTRSLAVETVPLRLAQAGLALLVLDTRAPRRLAEGAYAERRAQCERAAAVLGVPALRDATPALVEERAHELGPVLTRRARHVATEDERVPAAVEALRAGDFTRLGRLLDDSHASLRDDYEVSAPALDVAVEAARAAGALGARMTGAGFGGCALALVPADAVEAVAAAVADAFAREGLGEPEVFPVEPSAGARRLDFVLKQHKVGG